MGYLQASVCARPSVCLSATSRYHGSLPGIAVLDLLLNLDYTLVQALVLKIKHPNEYSVFARWGGVQGIVG